MYSWNVWLIYFESKIFIKLDNTHLSRIVGILHKKITFYFVIIQLNHLCMICIFSVNLPPHVHAALGCMLDMGYTNSDIFSVNLPPHVHAALSCMLDMGYTNSDIFPQ